MMMTAQDTEYVGFKIVEKECGCKEYYRASWDSDRYYSVPFMFNSCHAHNNNTMYLEDESFDYPDEEK